MEPSTSHDLRGVESVKVNFHAHSPGPLLTKNIPGRQDEQPSDLNGSRADRYSFEADLVIDRFSQPLLAAEVTLGRLHADVTQQELDLLQLTA